MSESMPPPSCFEVAVPEQEMLDIDKQIDGLLGWIIECGPAVDPLVLAGKRGLLRALLENIGFGGDDAIEMFYAFYGDLKHRASAPKPTVEIPNTDWFSERIIQIEAGGQSENIYIPNARLSDVSSYAHTDWSAVTSRDPRVPLAEYTRRMAEVMADPISYQLNIVESGHEMPIEVAVDMAVCNGRHRSLAARCLGPSLVEESDMARWVVVTTV